MMFFTKVGRVIAWLLFAGSAFRLCVAIAIATYAEDYVEMGKRYLGKNPGEAIDGSLMVLAFSICLGVATEISRSLHQRPTP